MRAPRQPIDYDSTLGRHIVELHIWAVSEGLRGAAADRLFDGFCQRLVTAGLPLWRGYAALQTLHPQWAGYSYTWRRDLNAIEPEQLERGEEYEQSVLTSPFYLLISEARAARDGMIGRHLRRRLAGPAAQLDFPILEQFAAAGPPIISRRSSASARGLMRHAVPGSAIPSRQTGRKASGMTTYTC